VGASLATPEPAGEARGRGATRPLAIPLRGWQDILWRTFREIVDDEVLTLGRSIAFSGVLALFPMLAVFVSLYGLFADPAVAQGQLMVLAGFVPAAGLQILTDQMVRLATADHGQLSLTFVAGLALSIWSANGGVKALLQGLNIAYDEDEKRSFVSLNLLSFAFTLGALAFFVVASGLVVGVPIVLRALRIDPAFVPLAWLRWPALLGALMTGLALLYRHGPSRRRVRWRWITMGSLAAALAWIAGSALFSWYLTNIADYDAAYGPLGALFGFMVWMWLSAVVVLCGAELNAEIESQTTGAPKGQRVMPPSMTSSSPVIQRASSEARKSTPLAMSSSV
jgi:membrane protein